MHFQQNIATTSDLETYQDSVLEKLMDFTKRKPKFERLENFKAKIPFEKHTRKKFATVTDF